MIHKNVQLGISENVTVAEFGTGTILTAGGLSTDGRASVAFFNQGVEEEIGTEHPERNLKTIDEVKYDVIFLFSDERSIDVVIDALQNAKVYMKNGSITTPIINT